MPKLVHDCVVRFCLNSCYTLTPVIGQGAADVPLQWDQQLAKAPGARTFEVPAQHYRLTTENRGQFLAATSALPADVRRRLASAHHAAFFLLASAGPLRADGAPAMPLHEAYEALESLVGLRLFKPWPWGGQSLLTESQVVHFTQFWSSDTLDGPEMHPLDATRMQAFLDDGPYVFAFPACHTADALLGAVNEYFTRNHHGSMLTEWNYKTGRRSKDTGVVDIRRHRKKPRVNNEYTPGAELQLKLRQIISRISGCVAELNDLLTALSDQEPMSPRLSRQQQ